MKTTVASIKFTTPLVKMKEWIIVQVPEHESAQLSSRGQVSVKGTINGHDFKTVVEPDGRWSHWFKVDDSLQNLTGLKVGDNAVIEMSQVSEWPEPNIPDDFMKALNAAGDIHELWAAITPMARWEWIRWVNATSNIDTRERRIEVSISKLRSGKRRPCCFNLAACTDPDLAKSGRLIEPDHI